MTTTLCILPGMSDHTDTRLYRVWRSGTIDGINALVEITDQFRTTAHDGLSADERAVANLIDHSTWHPYDRFVLTFETAQIAHARDGVGTLMVPLDDIQADACHAGPAITTDPAAASAAA